VVVIDSMHSYPPGCLQRDASMKAFVVQFRRDWLALGYSKRDGATSGGPLRARKSLSDMGEERSWRADSNRGPADYEGDKDDK